ncbi:MAG: FAD-dependent oxidoreductase [Acidobacteriaceae bacterium]|nr:FAD-dependent oxidoreductase [Acidobacteriaceae bacterium]
MGKKVAILGGGVAGMSAAHELAERGFQVEVYERQPLCGGKARSIPVLPELGDHGGKRTQALAAKYWRQYSTAGPHAPALCPWVPGEHGFRFFPSFYRHIIDTMERIPFGTGSVAGNMSNTTQVLLANYDKPGIVTTASFPGTLEGVQLTLNNFLQLMSGQFGVPPNEIAFFASRVWQVISSCEERRIQEYEKIGWWQFIGADERSEGYQKLLGHGITRSLVAAQAQRASTRTIGDIFLQLLLGIADPATVTSDRLLAGPTNEVWLIPWLDYLRSLGVVYHFETTVRSIECNAGMIRSVTVETLDGAARDITADYYIAAMPVERFVPMITPSMIEREPRLANLSHLAQYVDWMNGIQFYLTRDVPIVHGHAIYLDSAWAITSVSQRQFWPDVDLARFGDGKTRGIISVDISDWVTPGLNGKCAWDCKRHEIADEVWNQLKRSLNVGGKEVLRDSDLHYWYLDPDIAADPKRRHRFDDVEPLLVNLVDSWRLRPDAVTAIPNFFLASDYIQTYTDLATMEGANEAARRAVNGIIKRSGSRASPCRLWKLHEPELFEPVRAYDRQRWNAGLPWDDTAVNAALAAVNAVAGMPPTVVSRGAGPRLRIVQKN